MNIRPHFVDRETAAAMFSVSVSTWEKMVRNGKAPKPRQITDQRVAWRVSELDAMADAFPVSELPPPSNTAAPKPRKAKTKGGD